MLSDLRVLNFRSLVDFSVPRLGNVNLLVGKNNSGKSSVLEALRIYARRAHPGLLQEIAASHDESIRSPYRGEDPSDVAPAIPYRDFFSGRAFPKTDDQFIYIGNLAESDFVRISHTFFVEEYEEVEDAGGETIRRRKRIQLPKSGLLPEPPLGEQALIVSTSDSPTVGWIELSDAGLTRQRTPSGSSALFWERAVKETPVSYVPTQFLSIDYLSELWDSILFTQYAEEVKDALRILDDDFEDLGFVRTTAEDARWRSANRPDRTRFRSDRMPVVKMRFVQTGVPLNSMGDGMLRVLQFALTIFPAKGGLLLIDEFENGLHWSVQAKIWDALFRLSSSLRIQVFATTHSDDAVKAFSKIASVRPEDGVLLKLVRKGGGPRSATVAVSYDEETLETATKTETDVR